MEDALSSRSTPTRPSATNSEATESKDDSFEFSEHGIQLLNLRLDQLPRTILAESWYSRVYSCNNRYALKTYQFATEAVAGFTMAVAARDCAVHHHALIVLGGLPKAVAMELGTSVSVESTGLTVAEIATQLVQVVADLHAMDIVHGDIKLANFIYCKDKKIRLSDFKLARFSNNMAPEGAKSIPWCSPHILAGNPKPRTTRDDRYSLGATIWELYARRTPFTDPGQQPDQEDIRDLIVGGARLDMSEISDTDIRDIAEELMTGYASV